MFVLSVAPTEALAERARQATGSWVMQMFGSALVRQLKIVPPLALRTPSARQVAKEPTLYSPRSVVQATISRGRLTTSSVRRRWQDAGRVPPQ